MEQSPRTIRLNRFLSEAGVASRRKADRLIEEGAVQVNGKTVSEFGVKIHPSQDRVTVKGKPVFLNKEKIYIAYYKPEQMLTTVSDPEGRPTVLDVFKKFPKRLFPVGRLDWGTEGLLLLTNDGDWAQKIMHPRAEISKTYMAKLSGQPSAEQLQRLQRGISIIGGRVAAENVAPVRVKNGSRQYGWVKIVITEGRNQQVRQMFAKIGYDVKKLKRVAIGQLRLGSMQKGEFRILSPSECAKIFAQHKGMGRERKVSSKRL